MSADGAHQEGEITDLTTHLLAETPSDSDGTRMIRHMLPTVLPWVRFLPGPAVDELAAELVVTINATASSNNMTPVSQLLIEWRHTAEVYADPKLYAALSRPANGDLGPVPMPKMAT